MSNEWNEFQQKLFDDVMKNCPTIGEFIQDYIFRLKYGDFYRCLSIFQHNVKSNELPACVQRK